MPGMSPEVQGLLLAAHGAWRWVVLLVLSTAIFLALTGWRRNRPFVPLGRAAGVLTIASLDLQLLLGLALYATSPLVRAAWHDMGNAMKQHEPRFFAVEHITGMLVAIALAHIGFALAKRAPDDAAKYRRMFGWFVAAALILLGSIPWWRPWLRALIDAA